MKLNCVSSPQKIWKTVTNSRIASLGWVLGRNSGWQTITGLGVESGGDRREGRQRDPSSCPHARAAFSTCWFSGCSSISCKCGPPGPDTTPREAECVLETLAKAPLPGPCIYTCISAQGCQGAISSDQTLPPATWLLHSLGLTGKGQQRVWCAHSALGPGTSQNGTSGRTF